MNPATNCHHCGHMVYEVKRLGIMVDGVLLISVLLCLPCYENFNDHAMPLLDRRVGVSV